MWTARRSSRQVGIALVYHAVGEPAGDPKRELLPALKTRLFAKQVRHLASQYRLVAASDLLREVRARRRGDRFPVALTFDDDLRTHLDVVAPLLGARRLPATFFLTGTSLEEAASFWWVPLQRAFDGGYDLSTLALASLHERATVHAVGGEIERLAPAERRSIHAQLRQLVGTDDDEPGLSAADVARLSAAGFEIGFHTRHHDRLPELDDDALALAFVEGRRELENVLGHETTTFAYPHGRADTRVAAAAGAAGFETAYTGTPVTITPSSNRLLLGRISPSYDSAGELAFEVAWAIFRSSEGR